ncbi:MAG: hypothetical protein CVU64_03215 [Deltaproteobacteria bacterium HGW-Deltaproteobacteria-21]|nr:MAG: hypothetical protein CVU64_03215 [Deltaproteobacteria bacterium HGW-Deltaproteobacteria-21]
MARILLKLAGVCTFFFAVFQAVISFSPPWSLYFGAPKELAEKPELLLWAGLGVAVLLVACGVYALSGGGVLRSLPSLKWVLFAAGSIFVLRGLMVVPILLITSGWVQSTDEVPSTGLASSLTSLVVGLLYLAGVWLRRSEPNK